MDNAEVTQWVARHYARVVVYTTPMGGGEERVKVKVNGMEYHGQCPIGDHAPFLASVLDSVAWKLHRYQVSEEIERRRKMKHASTH